MTGPCANINLQMLLSNLACLPSWSDMAFSRTGLFFCKAASYPFPEEKTNSQEKAQGHSTLALTLKQKQGERPHSTQFISLKPTSRFFICERFMFCYPSPDSVWTRAHRSWHREEADLPLSLNLCSCHWHFLNQNIYTPKCQGLYFQKMLTVQA